MLPGVNKTGLQLATCLQLCAPRSCLNQSRCGSSIPGCRPHVCPAGHPRSGPARGPRVDGVETHGFSAALAGATGRRENRSPSKRPSADLGRPSRGPHLHAGVWPLSTQSPPHQKPNLKISRAPKGAGTIHSIQGTGRKVVASSVPPSPGVPLTHRCSAHSQRGGRCRAGSRWQWRPYSSTSRVGTGSCTPERPAGRLRGCWGAGTVSFCTAPSGGCSAASRRSPVSPVPRRRRCPTTCKTRRPCGEPLPCPPLGSPTLDTGDQRSQGSRPSSRASS